MLKPLTAALLLVIVMSGCEKKYSEPNITTIIGTSYNYEIVIIDGCQYIQNRNNSGSPLTHKGNCNNPIHKGK